MTTARVVERKGRYLWVCADCDTELRPPWGKVYRPVELDAARHNGKVHGDGAIATVRGLNDPAAILGGVCPEHGELTPDQVYVAGADGVPASQVELTFGELAGIQRGELFRCGVTSPVLGPDGRPIRCAKQVRAVASRPTITRSPAMQLAKG